MSKLGSLILASVVLAMMAPGEFRAVEQTGDISGIVRDDTGRPLVGATVTLRGRNLQGERQRSTDTGGEFLFVAVPPGSYDVRIEAPGWQTIEEDGIVVNVGRDTSLAYRLNVGALVESVSVSAKEPLIDTVRTQTQDSYGPEYAQKLSIGSEGRDYLRIVTNSVGTGPGDGEDPTVRGSTVGENLYLIDGVDSTDPVTATSGSRFVFDAIQEVQFQTGGFNAEYGRATGGIVNVVTKSGGNTFSGSLDVRYANQNFIEHGNHFDPGEMRQNHSVLEATFGGPIVKDRLWFFVAASDSASDLREEDFESTRSERSRCHLGKLTWQATPRQKLVLQVSGDPTTVDNADAGPLVAGEATSKVTRGSEFVSLQYQGVLRRDVLLQVQAADYRAKLDLEPQRSDFDTIGWIDFLTGRTTRNSVDVQYSQRFRRQINGTLTWSLADRGGDHTFKVGADLQAVRMRFEESAPGGEFDHVAPDARGVVVPLDYNVVQSAGRLENAGRVAGYFAQDEWRILPDLTLNAGLRYETFSYDDDRGTTVLQARLLEPRFAISWDATGDARNVFKLSGATFGDPGRLGLSRAANSRANSTDVYVNENIAGYFSGLGPTPLDVNGDGRIEDRAFLQRIGGPGKRVFAHGGNLEMTRVVEYTASWERQINATSAVGLTFVHRNTRDIIDDYYDPERGVYVIDNLGEARRNYYGVEGRFRARWRKLFLVAAYGWSKSRGSIEYAEGLAQDFDSPALSRNRYGYLSDDTRHALQTAGSYALPWDMALGFDYDLVSGYPWTVTQPALPYGTEFLTPRGANRLPLYHQLDLELRKIFRTGRTAWQASLTVTNALDTEIVTHVDTNVSVAGQPIEWQSPRRYELGARLTF